MDMYSVCVQWRALEGVLVFQTSYSFYPPLSISSLYLYVWMYPNFKNILVYYIYACSMNIYFL